MYNLLNPCKCFEYGVPVKAGLAPRIIGNFLWFSWKDVPTLWAQRHVLACTLCRGYRSLRWWLAVDGVHLRNR